MRGELYTPEFLRTETRKPPPSGNRTLFLLGGGLVVFSLVAFAVGLVLPGLTAPEIGAGGTHDPPPAREVPSADGEDRRAVREARETKNPELALTVPKMSRVKDVPVRTSDPDDTRTLDAGAMRLRGTGLPWNKGSNVYIAGHRIGYAGTGSFLLFYDLDGLREGDAVVLEGGGRRYAYRVTEKIVVGPEDERVTEPVPGKSVVSLQTCTLPDYRKRLVIRAELDEVRPNAPSDSRA
jgi:sortase A